jgi:hypothetical protein
LPPSRALAAALAPVPARRGQPRPTRRSTQRRIRLASIGWAAALLFVIAAGLFVAFWSASGPRVSADVALLAWLPGGQVLTFRGTSVPAASARLYVIDGGRRAELDVDALPSLPPSRVYQLWLFEADQSARSGGTFTVNQRGNAATRIGLPVPIDRVQSATITQEPAPGSPSPTGPRLLDWSR